MSLVNLEINGACATLRLNRIEQRNALNQALLSELDAAVDEIGAARPAIVFLRANGPAFSAGLDKTEFATLLGYSAEEVTEERTTFYRHGVAIRGLEMPVVAVLEGPAVTGGVGLAALCDFRLASTAAWLRVTFAELGFYAGLGMSETLRATGGPSFARRSLLLAERIEPDEAFRVGFYDWLVSPNEIETEVARITTLAHECDPVVVQMMKRKLDTLDDLDMQAVISEEAALEGLTSTFQGFKRLAPRFAFGTRFDEREPRTTNGTSLDGNSPPLTVGEEGKKK